MEEANVFVKCTVRHTWDQIKLNSKCLQFTSLPIKAFFFHLKLDVREARDRKATPLALDRGKVFMHEKVKVNHYDDINDDDRNYTK